MTRAIAIVFILTLSSLAGCNEGAKLSPSSAANSGGHERGVKGATGKMWLEGKHYELILPPESIPLGRPSAPVQVAEFFWYGCPHCYTLEPHIELWLRDIADHAKFVRVPATWNPRMIAHARLYYVLQELHREDLSREVFDTIHRRGNGLFSNDPNATFQEALKFAQENGIDPNDFRRTYNSPNVNANLKHAQDLASLYHIQHVPTIVVNGRYLTGPRYTEGNEIELLHMVTDLVVVEAQHSDNASPSVTSPETSTRSASAQR